MQTEKAYCSCGGELLEGVCTACGKEYSKTKPAIPTDLLKKKEEKNKN